MDSNKYVKTDCLLLPQTVSATPKNLAVKLIKHKKSAHNIAVIHHGCICVIPTRESQPNKAKIVQCSEFSKEKDIQVTQVAWCKLGYESVLLVTSTIGLQVINYQRNECLYFHPCNDSENAAGSFARGIAVFGSDFFCIGNSTGSIRLFGPAELGDEICFIDRKQFHNSPITGMATFKDYLVSADERGIIVLLNMEKEELIHVATLPSYNCCCIAVKMTRDWIVAAYTSGHIRLFDVTKVLGGNRNTKIYLSAEVAAHSRWITDLDIAEGTNCILTVSEDSLAKVWMVEKDGPYQVIQHKCNILVKDNMLFGGKFVNSSGSSFCVSSYDNNIVTFYSMQ